MNIPATLLLIVAVLFADTATAHAAKPVSKEDALSAIVTFQKDPSSKEGFAAAATLISFAQNSSAVRIYLSRDAIPWLKDRNAEDADTRDMLIGAYVAGNIRSQLTRGKPEDDPYAGWQQVLSTYAQLQAINPTVKLSEVDKLKDKEKNGSLRTYAEQVRAKHQAEEAKGPAR
jgi:hypothetical protein